MSAATVRSAPGPAAAETDKVVSGLGDWRILLRLAAYVRRYRRLVVIQLALTALVSGIQVVQPLIVRHAIDVAIPAHDARLLGLVALAFVAFILAEFGTRYGSLLAMMLTGQGVVRDLRKDVFARMERLDQATFDRTPVGRLMVRATSDVESLEEMFSSGVVTVVGDVLKLGFLLVAMLALDARLTLVALAITPVFLALSVWFRGRIRDAYRAVRARLSQLNAYLQEVIQGMRVVRLFAQETKEIRRFRERSDDLLRDDLASVRYDSGYSALVEMLSAFATASVIWYGGGSVVHGAVTFGTLYAFLSYAQQFFTPLEDVSLKYAVLQSGMASCERVFALLDQPDHVRSPVPGTVPAPPAPRGSVSYRHVTFAYGTDPPVLRDVSFDVAPGQTAALVGATGSGKTTITRLLNRLYDIPRGRDTAAAADDTPGGQVLLDGLDVRDYPIDVLRRRVGVVLQDPFLFSGSVRDNLFLPEGARDDAAWAALETVGAADLVRRLGGLDGELRERGNNLSAGERQLLTFARALIHDPIVLVLDEATAAVDSITERQLQRALERLTASRTTLVVAHRLSTVRRADVILVMHRGRLREKGTHDELLAHGGLYERLYRLQLRDI